MTPLPTRLPLVAVAAVLALPVAVLPAGAQSASQAASQAASRSASQSASQAASSTVPAAASSGVLHADLIVERVLPAAVVGDLTATQERRVEDALVAPGAGAVVSVAVEDADGGLVVEALDVARADAAGVASLLDGLPSVDEAAVAGTVRAVGAPVLAAGSSAASTAPDPLRPQQWPLSVLRAEDLRPLVASTPVVAVLDTGVDGTHPDLDDALVPGVDLVAGTGTGAIDPQGHGTHVAGIIAAEVGNGVGVEGLVGGARVMPVRVLGADGSGSTAATAQGVVAAVDRGASVLNLSLGGSGDDPVLARAVRYATDHGVLVVAAMGNDGQAGSPTSYPAAYPDVLAVAATDSRDVRGAFSSVGPHADVAAPGVSVLSTYPGGRYVGMSGTSMATPYAAATAAAVRGVAPALTPAQVTDVLTSTALDLGARGRDDAYGSGRVAPVAAVQRAVQLTGPTPTPTPAPAVPAAPASVTALAGDARASLRWEAPPALAGAEVTGYEVRLRATGRTDRVATTPADVRSLAVAGLVNATTYSVEVRARSSAGLGAPATTTVRPVAPATAPRSLRAVPGAARAALSWTAPTSTGASALTGYEVVVSARGRADVVVRTGAGTRTATVTGLVNGVDHTVRVRALTAAGAGPAATTTVRPRTTSTAPRSVSSAAGSTRDRVTGVFVTWSAPSSDGGAAVTSYRLLVRAEGARTDSVVTVRATAAGGAAQTAAVTGLRGGVRYGVTVQAVTAAGYGAASARTALVAAR